MHILRLTTTIVIAAGLFGCSRPSAGPQFTKDDVSTITNTIEELTTAFNAHDPDKVGRAFFRQRRCDAAEPVDGPVERFGQAVLRRALQ
jgi:hypothetical protein